MQQKLFRLNVGIFLAVWFGITGYTLWALVKLAVPYELWLFGVFLAVLTLLSLSLVWLWYRAKPKTIQHQTAVITTAVVLIFYWGPFAPIHSILSLHLDPLQLRWIAFAYIWEVVLVGAMVVYAVLYATRFADRFMRGGISKDMPAEDIHARIAGIPLRAWIAFMVTVLFGYIVGSAQLYYFSFLPLAETIKNLTNGVVAGTISAFVVFFALERILRVALQKSGSALQPDATLHRRRFSLFTKVYATAGLMALLSVGFFGTMAYGRAQAVLEDQMVLNMRMELRTLKERWEAGDRSLDDEERMLRFGEHGTLLYIIPETSGRILEGQIFSQTTRERIESLPDSAQIFVDRARDVNVIGLIPVFPGHLAAVSSLRDYDDALWKLVLYSGYIFVFIMVIVVVLATLFARSIILPIREIQEGSIRIGRGDFTHPITVYSNDELEDLSHALNIASTELQNSHAGLEDTISTRTREIELASKLQQKQIQELDETSKRLVRRDFELQGLNEKLREMDQSKSQFVSIAAHQLRTPLSAIKWTFSMFLSEDFGKLTEIQRAAISRGAQSTDRLIKLVGDLLNVARIEGGQIVYKFEPFNVDDMVNRAMDDVSRKAEEKHITLTAVRPRRKLSAARGDDEKMQAVLQNLLENAILYTPIGGKIKIKVSEKDKDYYQIAVSDTGIGIPESQMQFIFQKFFRAHNVVRFQLGGTGLGLYVTKRIVEAHGGTISVQSKEGKGSTFTVTLPYLV